MRRRISWLVAATTSAVVLAFVVPLALLVSTAAADRAVAAGSEEARSVAILISGADTDTVAERVSSAGRRSPARTSVLLPDGTVIGEADAQMAADPQVRRAATGRAFTVDDDQGGTVSFIPVLGADGTSVVRTTVDAELKRAGVYRAWVGLALLGSLLLAVALLIANRLGRRISEPVTDLAAVAQRLHEGDLDARAVPHGPEETMELGETLNRLAERIMELLAAERAAVGDLSHRLRTPVTALRLDAEAVDDRQLAQRLQEHIEQLQRTVDAIVRDARRPLRPTLAASCDASAVVATRAAFWSALAEDQGRPMDVVVPGHPVLVGLDAADLTDMLDVLVDNVFAHTHEDTAFSVRLLQEGGFGVLEVADTGTGNPVVTSDGAQRPGTSGLGLQIVRRTAASVGGHLDLRQDHGFVARVTLPAVAHHHAARS
jgi:signal transduction histidine kinase